MRKKISEEDKEDFKKQYFQSKEQLDKIRSDETLAKWKVLSKAYKLGKKIWGHRFTRQRLAFDMELPLTTCYRCLALDRANRNSWKKHDEGKISTFKLAMICQLKDITYQDEIVDMVIENNLSTYQIKDIKVKNWDDIKTEKHRLAISKGYSRRSAAVYQFKRWISRGEIFLTIDKTDLTKNGLDVVREDLEHLQNKINEFMK